MNYGQFLNMVPEFYLVLILLAVFVVDFAMHRSEKKLDCLFAVTAALLAVLRWHVCGFTGCQRDEDYPHNWCAYRGYHGSALVEK